MVVIQFSEAVQTRHDLAYNMTCTIKQPQDITVTSATLGAGYCLFHHFFSLTCSMQFVQCNLILIIL